MSVRTAVVKRVGDLEKDIVNRDDYGTKQCVRGWLLQR